MAPQAPLEARALGRATLARQGLIEPMRGDAADAVQRAGSLQAQHPEWPPVALAARAADGATADLTGALEKRQVVRSSLMRITIHVVHAEDLWPMFELMRPVRLDQWRLLTKRDPVSSPLGRRITAAHAIAVAALRERPRSSLELDRLMAAEAGLDGSPITRPAWRDPDARVVVRTAWRHFAAFVPLVHVPHRAEGYGRSMYALAEDWLGMRRPTPDEADARRQVARRYLAAFGPAAVDDLVAYTGRRQGGVRAWRDAIAALGDEVVTLTDDTGRALFDLADAPRPPADLAVPPRLLARWDSLVLSHAPRHRDRVVDDRGRSAVFSKNADVRPSFLVDGMVAGTWDLARRDGAVHATLRPIRRLPRGVADALGDEAMRVLGLIAPDAVGRTVSFEPATT